MSEETTVAEHDVIEQAEKLPAVRTANALVARDELSVQDVVGQADKIKQVMAAAMTEGVHFGKIPGVNKPTLLKPGAETLNVLLRLAPSYESEKVFHDGGHLTVISRCTLTHIPTGMVIAQGEGLCSTHESKYAYRKAERTCPECGEPQVRKGKARGSQPGNWYCWRKMGGCGATWPLDSDEGRAFDAVETGRVDNPDLPDMWNTVLKMADKRALIAATLNGTAASDIFTQDVEDTPGAADDAPRAEFDPGKQLLAGAIPLDANYWQSAGLALQEIGPTIDWRETLRPLVRSRWGVDERHDLSSEQNQEYAVRLSNAIQKVRSQTDTSAFPPIVETDPGMVRDALLWAFHSDALIEFVEHPEAQAAAEDAAAAADADDLPNPPLPGAEDDVPFGNAEHRDPAA